MESDKVTGIKRFDNQWENYGDCVICRRKSYCKTVCRAHKRFAYLWQWVIARNKNGGGCFMHTRVDEGEMTLDYIYNHHWGLFVDGVLEQEFPSFDEAVEEYERRGGEIL